MQSLLRLGVAEKAHYDELFLLADADKDGFIGGEDSAFFLKLGVEKKILSEVRQPISASTLSFYV